MLKNHISKLARFSVILTFIATSRRKGALLIPVLSYADRHFDQSDDHELVASIAAERLST